MMIGSALFPGPFAFVTPYEYLGTFPSTDLDHRECTIDVYSKSLSNVTPPGRLPRVQLLAHTPSGTTKTTYDTGWRFWVGNIRPIDGGIEVYHAYPHGGGVRFHLKDDHWILAEEDVLGVDPRELAALEVSASPEELRALIKLVHNSPGLDAGWFNPTALIRAVNGLRLAGKEKAIRALRAYYDMARLNDSHWAELRADRILPILQLLFVPEGGAPERPRLREYALRGLDVDTSAWPLFPLVVQEDIPFLPAPHSDRYADEVPDDVLAAVDYSSKYGVLRDKPLSPQAAPCQAVETLMATPAWKDFAGHGNPGVRVEGDLLIQALSATHTICPVTANQYNSLEREPFGTSDQEWKARVDALQELVPKWDAVKQDFVAGKTLH